LPVRAVIGVLAEPQAGLADSRDVDDVAEILHVGQDEILLVRRRRLDGRRERHRVGRRQGRSPGPGSTA
jgi:hypothetical protein